MHCIINIEKIQMNILTELFLDFCLCSLYLTNIRHGYVVYLVRVRRGGRKRPLPNPKQDNKIGCLLLHFQSFAICSIMDHIQRMVTDKMILSPFSVIFRHIFFAKIGVSHVHLDKEKITRASREFLISIFCDIRFIPNFLFICFFLDNTTKHVP
ncbi:hypothetical protein ACJX0J_005865, partial [Zea mays]